MTRLVLTEVQWTSMCPHCLGKPGYRGRSGRDGRTFVEAASWEARTGAPWRELPEMSGRWDTVWRRF